MAEFMPHNPLEGDAPELSFNLHDGSDEQVSIIIVHKDRPEYLNICLQTIAVTSFNTNYEIIVVDNASTTKDANDFLDDISNEVKVIRNEENIYWGPAANKGAAAADKNSKYFVFMHCDVAILNPAWLDLLINVSESQNAGFVGIEMQSYWMQQQQVDFIQEWLMLVTRNCWKEVGPFPEELPQVGPSFVFTIRAQNSGHNPQVMRNPIAHHYRIFSLDINEYEKLTEQAMVTIPKLLRSTQSTAVNPQNR
ncbi:MAG: glycosyltransferase family 2 protein [Candidatus Thorarchaeota archaeon]|jgi:GT2 family glycosyltransferase